MKKFLRFAILFLMIPAFVLTSCKDDDDDPTPDRQTDVEFQLLKDHLVTSNLDLDDILDGWITTASTIEPALNDYYVIDIRSAEAFATSHIPGAVNCAYGNVVTQAASAGVGQTVIVACYSGQTAGHAVAALRLSGYPTAKVLKWGMSGWHTTLDS
ncbi:MAG: rhodanese-like domain-containing protein, partial [Bacteroidales bacterium]|nr:rhodanese-like domain-containing protein [Bacteroidales bacterium]